MYKSEIELGERRTAVIGASRRRAGLRPIAICFERYEERLIAVCPASAPFYFTDIRVLAVIARRVERPFKAVR